MNFDKVATSLAEAKTGDFVLLSPRTFSDEPDKFVEIAHATKRDIHAAHTRFQREGGREVGTYGRNSRMQRIRTPLDRDDAVAKHDLWVTWNNRRVLAQMDWKTVDSDTLHRIMDLISP